jgi:hypothetical protein
MSATTSGVEVGRGVGGAVVATGALVVANAPMLEVGSGGRGWLAAGGALSAHATSPNTSKPNIHNLVNFIFLSISGFSHPAPK